MTTTKRKLSALNANGEPQLIVVEGNQGTGKTIVSRTLAHQSHATWLHFPPAFARIREELRLDTEVESQARLLYYLAATVHLGDLVRKALQDGPVVCDRYAASPVSLLLAEGAVDELTIERLWSPFEVDLPRPVLTLLLVCNYRIARERIVARGRPLTAVERRTVRSAHFYERRETALRDRASRFGPFEMIDTTCLSPIATCRRASSVLARVLGRRTPIAT
jgi:UMP-CMP kinase 2